MKILHTADWQIGRRYARFDPDDALALAEARWTTVERIAALATQEQVAAVLVAGDVFDAQTVDDRTIHRLFNAMQGFGGPWIMIPGNHDAALAESVWSRAARLTAIPANVQVLLAAGVREFPELGLAVLAAPLTQRQTHGDLTDWFDDAQTAPGLLRIGLAHGSVQGILADGIDSSNPIAPDRARRARLDYLALGDWHGVKRIDARTWYSGTPEQDRFKDNDAGHVLVVGLPGGANDPQVTPHRVTQYQWQRWQHTLAVASDLDGLLQRLAQLPASSVLDLTLSGQIDLESEQRLTRAVSEAHARCRSVRLNQTALQLVPTEQDIATLQADGYLGEVLAELQQAQHGADGQTAREALVILASLLRDRQAAGAAA